MARRVGRRAVYYNGRSPGFTSSIDRFIDDDACLIILSNNYAPVPQLIIKDLAAILFGEPYLIPQPLKPVRLMKDNMEPLLGQYRFGKDFYRPEAVVSVETDGQNLIMAWSTETQDPAHAPFSNGIPRPELLGENHLPTGRTGPNHTICLAG